jgi:sarcosine oxidase subunit alpha
MARAIDRKPANFVGRRSLLRPAARDPDRLQLVALRSPERLPVGAHFATGSPPARAAGYVTSSYLSPTLGEPVALGMLAGGTRRLDERVTVHHLGATFDAVVVQAPFIDPAGEKLHG